MMSVPTVMNMAARVCDCKPHSDIVIAAVTELGSVVTVSTLSLCRKANWGMPQTLLSHLHNPVGQSSLSSNCE